MSAKFIAQIEISNAVREQRQQAGRGDEPEDRQQQRQPGGGERAEREHEDRERHRPGEQLRLHHRVAVGGVEVAPHPGRAGERDAHARRAGGLQLRLERVGGGDHRRRVALGAGRHDRGVAVGGDARAGARRDERTRRGRSSRSSCSTLRDRLPEAGVGGREPLASGRRPSAPSWRGPAKFAWISSRACTDSEPFACQPAPESAVSTLGANTPSATATTAQAIATTRTWSAVQRPSRPSGPTASGCSREGAAGRAGAAATRHSPDSRDELVQGAQLLLHRAADLLAEREDALVDDPVVDVGSLLAAAEDADLGQHGEVLGDVLLRGAERLGSAR